MSRLSLVPACLTLAVLGIAHADDRWSVTTSFDMPGMPFPMPPQTREVCVSPDDKTHSKMVPMEDGCQVSNLKTTGNSTSFHMECAPPKKMSGDLKMTWSGNTYNGEMTAKTDMHGHSGTMKITYAGKKIGSCDHSENTVVQANQMMAQQQAMMKQQQAMQGSYMAQACQQAANEMNTQAVGMMTQMCPNLKTDICKAFSTRTASPDGLRQLILEKGDDWQSVAGFCGADAGAIKTKGCAAAKSGKNWPAAVDLCGVDDPDMANIAKSECGGLNFTAMPQDDARRSLRPVCSKYMPKSSGGGAIDTGKKALDNINKLRGLFGH